MSDYIPVNDRKPEPDTYVLCKDSDGDEQIMYFDGHKFKLYVALKGLNRGNYDVLVIPESLLAFPVTHWREL